MAAPGASDTEPAEEVVLLLGGVVLLLVGILSVSEGVAALAGSEALADADLIVGRPSTCGTALVILGGAAGLIAVSLWAGAEARWIAVTVAALNGIVQLLFMPAYPFLSLAVFALDVLAIFAFVVLVPHARSGRSSVPRA
jgi:hypothetical protein